MRSTHRETLALMASVALVATAGACGSGGTAGHDGADHAAMSSSSSTAATASSARTADVAFAQGMIPHHEQAVEMADIAVAHPDVSAEVKDLATAIKAAQDPEIKQMQGWLREWDAPATAGAPGAEGHAGHGMMPAEAMDQLEAATGEDFNRMWMEMMIDHHAGATMMAENVLASTQDADVKALAGAIIKAQKAEIEQMQSLLA